MTKERSTATDCSTCTTNDGRSHDGQILPEFGAGRKACRRAEASHILRQASVVYHRLYDRVFDDQCSASTTLLSSFIPRRTAILDHLSETPCEGWSCSGVTAAWTRRAPREVGTNSRMRSVRGQYAVMPTDESSLPLCSAPRAHAGNRLMTQVGHRGTKRLF